MSGGRLHPGPAQSAAEVAADRRGRLRRAMTEMVYERGYAAVTVRELIKRAQVSKATLYKLYAGKEDCFHAAHEEIAATVLASVADATRGSATRADLVERGLEAFAGAVVEQPAAGCVGLLEPLAVGDAARARMRKTESDFAGLFRRRLGGLDDGFELPASVAYGGVGGVAMVARERLKAADPAGFQSSVEELANWALAVIDPALLRLGAASPGSVSGSRHQPWSVDIRALPIATERALLLDATLRLTAEGGYERLTPANIAALAGVSQSAFVSNFVSVEACFTQTLELGVLAVITSARAAFESADRWALGVHRALGALCRCFADEPGLARLAFVDIFVPGRAVTRESAGLLTTLAKLLCKRAPSEERPSRVAAQASVGAIWTLLRRAVAAGHGSELSNLAPVLSWLTLAPAIGGETTLEIVRERP